MHGGRREIVGRFVHCGRRVWKVRCSRARKVVRVRSFVAGRKRHESEKTDGEEDRLTGRRCVASRRTREVRPNGDALLTLLRTADKLAALFGGDHAVRVGMSHMNSVWLRIQMGRGQTSSKVGADDVRRKPYGKNANVFCGEQRGGPMGRNDASPRRSSEPPALCIFLRSTRR